MHRAGGGLIATCCYRRRSNCAKGRRKSGLGQAERAAKELKAQDMGEQSINLTTICSMCRMLSDNDIAAID